MILRDVFLCVALAVCLSWPPILAVADTPAPFPDFEAKRVKPPKPGETKRIRVQIEPVAAPTAAAQSVATNEAAAKAAPPTSYGWFWEGISPALSATGPGRLEPAMVQLSNPPQGSGVAAPPLSEMQHIIQGFGGDILLATIGTQVSPALVAAIIAVESAGRADAVSHAGAQGLMQLMPDTAARFGVTDSLEVTDNISGGVRFLDFLMAKFDRDPILVLAGYNAGENSISTHDGVPPFSETRDYVPKVLAAYGVARALCITPPELITDGCVFALK